MLHTSSTSTPGENQTLVYLVRHAQTTWNLERRFQGQFDVPLSAEGIRQSEAVARWLRNERVRFAAIYTSDLLRARQTAEPIAERLGLVPEPVHALREIHAGDWQGLVAAEIEELYPGQLMRWREEANDFRLPGGETVPEVQARVLAWYNEAIKAHKGQAIVAISHGMAIRSLLAALNGWDLADAEKMKTTSLSNTGVTAVFADHTSGESTILFLNSLHHLGSMPEQISADERTQEPAAV